jgi:hypothetical protein
VFAVAVAGFFFAVSDFLAVEDFAIAVDLFFGVEGFFVDGLAITSCVATVVLAVASFALGFGELSDVVAMPTTSCASACAGDSVAAAISGTTLGFGGSGVMLVGAGAGVGAGVGVGIGAGAAAGTARSVAFAAAATEAFGA